MMGRKIETGNYRQWNSFPVKNIKIKYLYALLKNAAIRMYNKKNSDEQHMWMIRNGFGRLCTRSSLFESVTGWHHILSPHKLMFSNKAAINRRNTKMHVLCLLIEHLIKIQIEIVSSQILTNIFLPHHPIIWDAMNISQTDIDIWLHLEIKLFSAFFPNCAMLL